MEFLLQLTVNGVVSGAIFALMAVGFALIYSTTRIFHVAYGGVFTVGAYSLFFLTRVLGVPLIAALVGTLAITTALGLALELWGYRPLRKRGASLATYMLGSFGLFIILQNLVQIIFGTQPETVREAPLPSWQFAGARITFLHLMVIGACVIIFPAIHLFLTKAKLGKAVRALADNPHLATVIGINTNRLYLVIAALGSALAGVSAIFVAVDVGVTLEVGFTVLLIAAVAAIIGGVGHLPGAGVAAFMLGLIQNLSAIKLSPQWQEAVAFTIFIFFLIFRPQGLFGARLAAKKP